MVADHSMAPTTHENGDIEPPEASATIPSTSTDAASPMPRRRVPLVYQESAEASPIVDLSRKRSSNPEIPVPKPVRKPWGLISWRSSIETILEIDRALADNEVRATTNRTDDEEGIDRMVRSTIKLERLLWFGVALCLDQILSFVTVTPLRIAYNLTYPRSGGSFSAKTMFDVSCFSIFALTLFFLVYFVGAAQVYHSIRLQTFMKLYVVVNIAEVLDRLLSSLGLDLFELLADASAQRKLSVSFAVRYFLCVLYTCLHSLLFYVRLLTLSVAVNSSNDALFTILVSNNFVELKGSVFKRSTEQNLFQISCSDVVERFVLIVFMLLVGLNEFETRKSAQDDESGFVSLMFLVLSVEVMVDWIKHMFIVRFNSDIKVKDCYDRFLNVLTDDYRGKSAALTEAGESKARNMFPAVSRRLGLPIVPICALIVRVFVFDVSDLLYERSWFFIFNGWMICFATRLGLKYILKIWSQQIADEEEALVLSASLQESSPSMTPKTPIQSPPPSEFLASLASIAPEKVIMATPMASSMAASAFDLGSEPSKITAASNKKNSIQKVLSRVSRFENG